MERTETLIKHYFDTVVNAGGVPVASATVKVTVQNASPGTGALATLYSDNGVTTIPNPVTTDANGRFNFYVADGRYDLTISATGLTTLIQADQEISDILQGGTGDLVWQSRNVEGIRYADQFPGADIGAQINNAIADLPAQGGIVYLPNGFFNMSTQVVPAKNVAIIGQGGCNASQNITQLTWTGAATAPFVISGGSTTGCRLQNFGIAQTTATPAPVAIDIDNSTSNIELTDIVIDTPTNAFTVAGIRFGNSGIIDDIRGKNIYVKTAAPIGLLLNGIQSHAVFYQCRALQATGAGVEWQIGGSQAAISIKCYGCTAEAGSGNTGIQVLNVRNFLWSGGYTAQGGSATAYAVDIPNTATLAQNVVFEGVRFGNPYNPGANAAVHVNLSTAEVSVLNSLAEGSYASANLVKNDSASRILVLGCDCQVASMGQVSSQTNAVVLSNTTLAALQSNFLQNITLTAAASTTAAAQVSLGSTTATSATAGTNGAVPGQVAGYLIINVAGTAQKIPFFNS